MTWVKVDDQFFRHPKARRAGKDGRMLYLTGLAYCTANFTDGHIHADALRLVAAEAEVRASTAKVLVEVGLWEVVEDGYVVHDYLEYQPSAEKMRAEREAAKERMRGKRGSKDSPPPSSRSSPELRAKFGRSSPSPSRPVPDVPDGTSTDTPTDEQTFDHFWDAYPKRNGKRVGRNTSLRLWKHLGIEDQRAAYRGAGHYATACDSGLTIAKDPERFLKHRVWEDWQEPAVASLALVRANGHRPSAVERSWRNILEGPTEGIR